MLRCNSKLVSLAVTIKNEPEQRVAKKIHDRIISNLLDVLVLSEIRRQPTNGYALMKQIQQKHGLIVCAGKMYSLISTLEKNGLIECVTCNPDSKEYRITPNGVTALDSIARSSEAVKVLIPQILTGR